jgi:hypothetical protein
MTFATTTFQLQWLPLGLAWPTETSDTHTIAYKILALSAAYLELQSSRPQILAKLAIA